MSFLTKISSLKEKALCHVALNLCQDNSFKEVAMCLEKPTYGITTTHCAQVSTLFISPSVMCLIQTKLREAEMKEDDRLANTLLDGLYSDPKNEAVLWDVAVEEQCQRLAQGFPSSLKSELYIWINRFALEYLSYCRRQESLFGISRYFLIDILTRDDWTDAGRLNEMKIAKRLLRDKQLTNVQKYRIICVYSLHRSVPVWWNKLTQEEKESLNESNDPHYEENNSLVSVWCNYMKLHENVELRWQKMFLWKSAAEIAVCYGNKTALMFFWQKIPKRDRPWAAIRMALQTLQEWKISEILGLKREKLVSNEYCSPCEAPCLNLPHYYSELLHFFLSEMSESKILIFFEQAFEKEDNESEDILSMISVLECFLDWPLHDHFLPIMNLLWGTIPKSKYGRCLLSLAYKYSGELKRYYTSLSLYSKIHICDYGSMLWNLWKATPDEYKQYVFYDDDKKRSDGYSSTWIKRVLFQLLEKDTFEKRDEALFKQFWLDLPQEVKITMIRKEPQKMSLFGYEDDMCWKLLEKEKWSLANWLLEENFLSEEILNYKKLLMESKSCYFFCKLQENCFQFIEDMMDWCLLEDTEKIKYKYELFTDRDSGLEWCSSSLTQGEFTKVEKMIDFCSSSDETKREIKLECGEDACRFLVDECKWELMDRILIWCNKPEKDIPDYKKFLFFCLGLGVHVRLVFVYNDWENVECFYKWFCLSPDEMLKIKKETVFFPGSIKKVHEALYEDDIDEIEPCLRWCLTNKEIVINFKEEFEKKYFNMVLIEESDKKAKKCFDYLIRTVIYDLNKEAVYDVTNREDTVMKDKGEKRFLTIENGSNSAKRLKHKT